MPDISMCTGESCPSKEKCYRFTAEPSAPYQTYANFNDGRFAEACAHFMEIWDKSPASPKGDGGE